MIRESMQKTSTMQLPLFDSRSASERFAVRVSERARRLTARVHVGGRVEIVVPRGVGPRAVRDFVRRFTPWIDRKVAAMGPPADAPLAVPAEISLAMTGERFAVRWQAGARRRVRVAEGQLLVRAPDEPGARRALRGWLRHAAAQRLAPKLMHLAGELKHQVAKIAIRCQRTRWGSCSSRGTVSLNCSLLFLPDEVVRYLLVHELTHLRHMNHSPRFWRAVEAQEPQFRRLDAELLAGWREVPDWVFRE
jgi:predicted metal-dependent hydrolase